MWQKFMDVADRDYPEEEFPVPSVHVRYDPFFQSTYAVAPTSSSTISTTTTIFGTNPSDGLPPDITAPPTTTTSPPSTSF